MDSPISNQKAILKQKSLTCSLCLLVFRDPKLLPCFHTFCKKCLSRLLQSQQGRVEPFSCPVCREIITVPAAGVSGFQTNFYIDEDELDRAREMCSVHPWIKLSGLCLDCDVRICLKCKISDHVQHESHHVASMAKQAKSQLYNYKETKKIELALDDIRRLTGALRIEQTECQEKKASVERGIRDRHRTIVTMADKFLTEGLNSLERACSGTEYVQSKLLQTNKNTFAELEELQKRMDQTLQNGDGWETVSIASDTNTECERVGKLARQCDDCLWQVSRPIHETDAVQGDAMFENMKKFIGGARQINYDCSDRELAVVNEEIQCGSHDDSVVYCVCPGTNDYVRVSFEPSFREKEPRVIGLSINNQDIVHDQSETGRCSMKRYKQQNLFVCTIEGEQRSVVKCSSKKICYLETTAENEAQVIHAEVITEDPFETEISLQFTIQCGPHRAIDVDSSEQFYVVVEESMKNSRRRQVKLFRRQRQDAVDIYHSPLTPCQPADVCFYTLKGQEVLLIADELNDAIHVVEIKEERLIFSHYLFPGCPLLVKPTALNTDVQGRVWVGCRGGRLLAIELLP